MGSTELKNLVDLYPAVRYNDKNLQVPGMSPTWSLSQITARNVCRKRQGQRKESVIAGGDSGIGLAVAIAFAREGADGYMAGWIVQVNGGYPSI